MWCADVCLRRSLSASLCVLRLAPVATGGHVLALTQPSHEKLLNLIRSLRPTAETKWPVEWCQHITLSHSGAPKRFIMGAHVAFKVTHILETSQFVAAIVDLGDYQDLYQVDSVDGVAPVCHVLVR